MSSNYEIERQENIQRNKELLKSLGIDKVRNETTTTQVVPKNKRKLERIQRQPTRLSARIASAPLKPRYRSISPVEASRGKRVKVKQDVVPLAAEASIPSPPPENMSSLVDGWSSWEATEPEPERDTDGVFHFASHPMFTPNKSPAEIIREGAFGGGYFRPVYSSKLHMTVRDDYLDTVPETWRDGLNTERYLTSEEYDPEVNKFGVSCGQTIEEWEKAGWIRHEYDVRGWFQWYCRFFRGRRCDDDDRQVGRWSRCAGDRGRWRRMLLKKYMQAGVRSVIDEGLDDDEEGDGGGRGLSPVVHQTCHHWAYSVTQAALDQAWAGL